MPFPLFDLARRIEDRRTLRRIADVQSDPHLARDLGLPYRPREPRRIERW